MNNWIVRSLTGIVYIACIVGAIIAGGVWFYPLLLALGLPSALEFKRLCLTGATESKAITIIDLCGYALIMLTALGHKAFGIAILGGVVYLIARMIAQIYLPDNNPHRVESYAGSFATLIYIVAPLLMMVAIPCITGTKWVVLAMFILIWVNDTGAFVVGCTIGKHRLFERVSPKKSWEGFFGGLVFAVACSVGLYFTGLYSTAITSAWVAALYGAVVTVFATFGDLLESSLKRAAGVKDSGHILPGHGGMLDRIDSLLMVAPATFAFLLIIELYLPI